MGTILFMMWVVQLVLSCSNSHDDDSLDSLDPKYYGKYISECTYDDTFEIYIKKVIELDSNSILSKSVFIYDDKSCDEDNKLMEAFSNYKISVTRHHKRSVVIEQKFISLFLTIYDSSYLKEMNDNQEYNHSDWELGVKKEVTKEHIKEETNGEEEIIKYCSIKLVGKYLYVNDYLQDRGRQNLAADEGDEVRVYIKVSEDQLNTSMDVESDKEDEINKLDSSYLGQYSSQCIYDKNIKLYFRQLISINSDSTIFKALYIFKESSCNDQSLVYRSNKINTVSVDTQYENTLIIKEKLTYFDHTIYDPASVLLANEQKLHGYTEWEIGEEKVVTEEVIRSYKYRGIVYTYSAIKIEGDKLYIVEDIEHDLKIDLDEQKNNKLIVCTKVENFLSESQLQESDNLNPKYHGKYYRPCYFDDRTDLYGIEILWLNDDSTISKMINFYKDSSCSPKNAMKAVMRFYDVLITENRDENISIKEELSYIGLKIIDSELILTANNETIYGYTDWEVEEFKMIYSKANKVVPLEEKTERFHIIQLEDDKLYVKEYLPDFDKNNPSIKEDENTIVYYKIENDQN